MEKKRNQNKWYLLFAVLLLVFNTQKTYAIDNEVVAALFGVDGYKRAKTIFKSTYGKLCPKFSLKMKTDCGRLETIIDQTLIFYVPKSGSYTKRDGECFVRGVFSSKRLTYVGEMAPKKIASSCNNISLNNVKFHGLGAIYSPEGKKIQSGRYIDHKFEGEINKVMKPSEGSRQGSQIKLTDHLSNAKQLYQLYYGKICPKYTAYGSDCGVLESRNDRTIIHKSKGKCIADGVISLEGGITYVGEMTTIDGCYPVIGHEVAHGNGSLYNNGELIKEGYFSKANIEKVQMQKPNWRESIKPPQTAPKAIAAPKVGPRRELVTPKQDGPRLAKPNIKASPNKKQKTDASRIVTASTGSGFAVSSNGHLITNHHVINGCQEIFVHVNGNGIPAQILLADHRNDLALLKAEFSPDHSFPLSKDGPELMADIFVAGYPFGKNFSASITVTKGIVSRLTGLQNNLAQMQIDAAIQSGNSGGPIIDQLGNVVGVAVSKLDYKGTLKKFGSIPENINFGIKANMVDSLLRSVGVTSSKANDKLISNAELGKQVQKGTFYIACRMTMAQINRMKTEKVMFSEFD